MGGHTREVGQSIPFKLTGTVTLDDSGYVMSIDATAGVARKASHTDKVYGVALWSTESARHYAFDSGNRVYQKGSDFGDIAITRNGQVMLKLAPAGSRDNVINIGDELAVVDDANSNTHANAGTVDRSVIAGTIDNATKAAAEIVRRFDRVVGIAEEKVESNVTKSHILSSLRILGGVGP